MRSRAFALLLVTLASVLPRAQDPAPQLPRPRLETRAEVVLVDVSVLDKDNRPIEGLTAADFELEVNGQPRAIQNLQYISTVGTKSISETSPRDSQYSSNDAASTGRLLLFVVDEDHLRFGGNSGVVNTAGRLLDGLAPGDLVGLARLPDGTGGVEFTADHERVRRALGRVTGRQPSQQSELRLSEAWAFETNRSVWDLVVERECNYPRGNESSKLIFAACVNQLEAQARMIVGDATARGSQSIRLLEDLISRLTSMHAPITVILISEGLFVGHERGQVAALGRRAAEARVTLHIVQPGESMFDRDKPMVTGSPVRDQDLLGEGLDIIAGETRGSHYTISASTGAGAFERIRRELSGYYLLAFEPTDADRSSRDRKIKVNVRRKGAIVRSRSTYALADTAAAAATAAAAPEEQLQKMLTAPLPVSGLPIRVATYSVTNAESAKVRVIVSAEIGEPATDSVEWPVGLIVFDKNQKLVVNTFGPMKLSPANPRSKSPRLLLNAIVLDPGEYMLRLAAIGPDGRSGSVHHVVDARLQPVGSDAIRVSDFIIAAQPATADEGPRPTPSSVIDSDALVAALELAGTDTQRMARAKLKVEIAESPTAPALVSGTVEPITRAGESQHAFAVSLKLGLLPPGEYVARAILTIPGLRDTRFTRAFRAVPPVAPAVVSTRAAPADPDAAPAPPPPSRIFAPVPRFAPEQVLRPEVVAVFLDALAERHPPSDLAAPIVAQARKGTFVVSDAEAAKGDADEPSLAFVRGLAALQKNEIPQAANWFQVTLKNASDFLGAAFYLGAVHAASGRDPEAVGAWQMSLIGEGGDRAYPVLVDALLRTGDAQAALDFIAEAPDAWPSNEARQRRVAIAQAMLGQYSAALETVTNLLKTEPDDVDLLFVALQVMYRRHTDAPLSAEDRQRFEEYAASYERNHGPQAALVASWRKYVSR